MMNDFQGKVVVVTGGSSGIGRAAAVAFARAGAKVVLAARGVERGNQVVREIEAGAGRRCLCARMCRARRTWRR
jgi:NAD(P)-dependent dehydrogenase (short-subunit alcohol dehydrogenase family)